MRQQQSADHPSPALIRVLVHSGGAFLCISLYFRSMDKNTSGKKQSALKWFKDGRCFHVNRAAGVAYSSEQLLMQWGAVEASACCTCRAPGVSAALCGRSCALSPAPFGCYVNAELSSDRPLNLDLRYFHSLTCSWSSVETSEFIPTYIFPIWISNFLQSSGFFSSLHCSALSFHRPRLFFDVFNCVQSDSLILLLHFVLLW